MAVLVWISYRIFAGGLWVWEDCECGSGVHCVQLAWLFPLPCCLSCLRDTMNLTTTLALVSSTCPRYQLLEMLVCHPSYPSTLPLYLLSFRSSLSQPHFPALSYPSYRAINCHPSFLYCQSVMYGRPVTIESVDSICRDSTDRLTFLVREKLCRVILRSW